MAKKKSITDTHYNKDIFWNSYSIKQYNRELSHKHRSLVLWFTGLSGSGKSFLANCLEKELYYRSINTYILDGDNIRHGLCKDLGFNNFDRCENIRRVGEVAKLMVDAGIVVLAAFVSPYYSDRQMVRKMFAVNSFVEIFVDTPLRICEKRDLKGLYKRARDGFIKNFTGINSQYEPPTNPEIYLDGRKSIFNLMEQLLEVIISKIAI